MSKLIDLTGRKFGRLTVICRSGTYQRPSGNKEPTWRCKCECGNEVVVMSSNLKRKGNTLSCGCLQTENRFGARRETECEVREDVVYVKTFEGAAFVVSSCDLDTVKLHRWRINAGGYITDERGHTIHRTLMLPPAVMDVHHINGNKLDNRRSNLLILSRSEHTALHQQKDIAHGVTVQECGHWVYDFNLGGSNFYRCSVCDRQETLLEKEDIYEYCPFCHCGAKMMPQPPKGE